MRRPIVVIGVAAFAAASTATVLATVAAWLSDRRLGSGFVNRVIDPVLVERGVSGAGTSEIGTIEHIGRRSGTRRLTPIHPVPVEDGFRVVVPLAERSEWAQNVLAAGHCRLQLHDIIHELDEPVLLEPEDAPGLSPVARWLSAHLGFRYLVLHEFSSSPGSLLEPTEVPSMTFEGPALEPVEQLATAASLA